MTTRLLRSVRPRVVITLAVILAIAGIAAFFVVQSQSAAPARAFDLIYARRQTITATVNATGQIEPAQNASLSFAAPGRVAAVLVAVGDQVRAGDPLARLDSAELELRLVQAEAQLRQAVANRQKLLVGPTAEDLAASEAQVRQALAQLKQVSGNVSPADLAAATAQLEQAQIVLQTVEAGADPNEVTLAQTQLEQARTQFNQQRDQLSASKTNAELALQTAASSLTQAQARYGTAKENWDYVRETGNDPLAPRISDPTRPGSTRPNRLSDAQQRQYYDAFVQAETTLRNAENAVAQAQTTYDNARQAEVNGVRNAEQGVVAAEVRLSRTSAGATPDQLAQARAGLAQAQANLNRLRGPSRDGALESAQASVDLAEARLAQLSADPRPEDLEGVSAQLTIAEASRDQARLALQQATLSAPFSGVIAEMNLQVGEVPSAARAAIVLSDLASYFVTVKVDEIDIPRLSVGQPVTLTLDALPDTQLAGQVETIAPLADALATVTSYAVRISARADDPRVRPGMSASADITVARKDDALLVPRRAVRNDRGRLVIDVVRDQASCQAPATANRARPELESRDVRTGLSNELLIEIIDGLDEQTCVYVEGIDARLRVFTGPPRPQQR